jgi:hypothetical protein
MKERKLEKSVGKSFAVSCASHHNAYIAAASKNFLYKGQKRAFRQRPASPENMTVVLRQIGERWTVKGHGLPLHKVKG